MKPRARRSTTVHSVSPRAAPARAAVSGAGAVTPQRLPEVELQSARVPASEFKRRRARLMSMMEPGSVAILPSATNLIRNRDTEYPFRQDSDFHYLTGFNEPEAVLFLVPGRAAGETLLFCRERDGMREQWTGERLGPERATQTLGVDDAFPITDLDDIGPGLIEGRHRVYYGLGAHPDFDRRVLAWLGGLRALVKNGAVPPGELAEVGLLLHELRLLKSTAELKVMRAAAAITAAAHDRVMRVCKPGLTEARLEAELLYGFALGGARHPAYECIVGAGENACVMHYVGNRGPLNDGDLVLIDAGCEYQHYASDVTRTYPINGRYSGEQRALYEVVLRAQLAAIETARVGQHFNAPHEACVRVIVDGLLELGILTGDAKEIIETESHRRFTVHKSSHWLGLDVHDVGEYRIGPQWRELQPGMVLTIEPGCYIPSSMTDVPARFRGMGIRIEDDVRVTASEPDVLTAAIPKRVEDIERVMRGG